MTASDPTGQDPTRDDRSDQALTRDYRAAFELGRSAVVAGTSLLTLVQIHHRVLLEVLRSSRPDDLVPLATVASEFLLEVLSTFDMTHRALRE